MKMLAAVAILFLSGPVGYDLEASYVPPPKAGANGLVSVTFAPRDPDFGLDEEPAPRLKLDPLQAVLVDRQPASTGHEAPPKTQRFHDTKVPLGFAVALAPDVAKGIHPVKGTVTYFYCSQREGWCRKGSAEVSFNVDVP